MSNSPTVGKGCYQICVQVLIEKNNHVTIVAFLLKLGTCTRVDNCGACIDNAFSKSGVDVRGGGRGTFRFSFDAPFQRQAFVLVFSRPTSSIFCSSTLSCVLQSALQAFAYVCHQSQKKPLSLPQRSIFRKAQLEHRVCCTELYKNHSATYLGKDTNSRTIHALSMYL